MENIKNKVYLFHEINTEILKSIQSISKNEPEAILTFDDGLYSNYLYLDELKKLPNKKIFFISLGILRDSDTEPNLTFIKCSEAHRQKDTSFYMSINEVNEIENLSPEYNCSVGLHGVDHIKCFLKGPLINKIHYPLIAGNKKYSGIKECSKIFKEEIDKMFIASDILLDKKTKYFAWPYNIESSFMHTIIVNKVRTLNIELKLFGRERLEYLPESKKEEE